MIPVPAAAFAQILRKDPDAVARMLTENLEALGGAKVTAEVAPRTGPDLAGLFGERKLYVFPIETHQGKAFPALLVFDIPAAVHAGGVFSMLGPEQIKEVLASGEIPDVLHDAIGEVANILCGAASNMVRTRVADAPQFRRAPGFRQVAAGPWPSVLGEFPQRLGWEFVPCRLAAGGEERGAVLLAASEGERGRVSADEVIAVAGAGAGDTPASSASDEDDDIALTPEGEATPPAGQPSADTSAAPSPVADRRAADVPVAPPARDDGTERAPTANPFDGIRVLVTGNPADPAAAALRSTLEVCRARVLPAFTATADQSTPPDVLFVVSRSPVDLSIRLERMSPARRPGLVVACSDRPTRDLVVAARSAGADEFLVLPTTPERLRGLLARIAAAPA